MAEPRPQTATAATGTVDLHAEPAVLGITAAGVVALAMLFVIAIAIWKKVPAIVGRMLDARIEAIRAELDEALRLRAEAEAMLAAAQVRDAASAGEAEAIVAHAQAEAQATLARAETDAADIVNRRRQRAEDRSAAAERQALGEVRATAADAATRAAGAIIARRYGPGEDRGTADRTIATLGRPN